MLRLDKLLKLVYNLCCEFIFERIIIYKSHIGWVAGVCLENISEWKYASLQERRMFYGIVILSIEKKGNMCYLNMLM